MRCTMYVAIHFHLSALWLFSYFVFFTFSLFHFSILHGYNSVILARGKRTSGASAIGYNKLRKVTHLEPTEPRAEIAELPSLFLSSPPPLSSSPLPLFAAFFHMEEMPRGVDVEK